MKSLVYILLFSLYFCEENPCVSSFSSVSRTFYITKSNPTFRLLSKDPNGFSKLPNIFYGNRNDPLYEKCEISGIELICTFSKRDIDTYLDSTVTITEMVEGCDRHINTRFYIMFAEDIEHCDIYNLEEFGCKKCDSLYIYDEDRQECKMSPAFKFLVIGLPIIGVFILFIIIICLCKSGKSNNY